MTQVTAIDAYWLGESRLSSYACRIAHRFVVVAELGGVFYSVREKNFDGRGTRNQKEREFSKQAELQVEMARAREE